MKQNWKAVDQESTKELQSVESEIYEKIWKIFHCQDQWAREERIEQRKWWPEEPLSKEAQRAQMYRKSFNVKKDH